MQNKRLLLLVLGLAVGTFVLMALSGGYLGGGMMSQIAPSSVTNKRMVESDAGMQNLGFGRGPEIYPYPYPPMGGGDALQVDERVYLHSASHDVIVDDVHHYLGQMRDYVTSVEGRVLSYNVSSAQKYQSGYLQAKVPVERFQDINNRVKDGVKEVIRESVDSQDVTGTVVGNEERVEQLRQRLEELQAELAALQSGTPEYSRVQIQIDSTERQLEQAENRDEQMDENVQYASIYISAADSKRFYDPGAPVDPLTELKEAIESLGGSLQALLYLLIWVVVYAVIWLPVVLVVRWVWKKLKGNQIN